MLGLCSGKGRGGQLGFTGVVEKCSGDRTPTERKWLDRIPYRVKI